MKYSLSIHYAFPWWFYRNYFHNFFADNFWLYNANDVIKNARINILIYVYQKSDHSQYHQWINQLMSIQSYYKSSLTKQKYDLFRLDEG